MVRRIRPLPKITLVILTREANPMIEFEYVCASNLARVQAMEATLSQILRSPTVTIGSELKEVEGITIEEVKALHVILNKGKQELEKRSSKRVSAAPTWPTDVENCSRSRRHH